MSTLIVGSGGGGGGSYTDADAIAAVENEATLDLTGDVTTAVAKTLQVNGAFELTTGAALNQVMTSSAAGAGSWAVPAAANVSNTPAGSVVATEAQAAIDELAAGRVNRTAINLAASPYTALATDQLISVDCTGGSVTINLPTAVSVGAGKRYEIKDALLQSGGANTITIDANAVETIDLAATLVLNSNGTSFTIVSDGASNWEII